MESTQTIKNKIKRDTLEKLLINEVPEFIIKQRTKNNVFFDEQQNMLKLGDLTSSRKLNSLAELRSFAQTILVARTILDAKKEVGYTTQRDIFYRALETIKGTKINTFEEQKESNAIIEDLEVYTGLFREEMGVITDPKGFVTGKLKLKGKSRDEEQIIDCTKGLTGQLVPPNIHEIEIIDVDADYVLVIEKGGIFTTLREVGFDKKNKCIICTAHGQPDRATRKLVRRLNIEHHLPVYILTDCDPWGWYMGYAVYRIGSQNLGYESERLACPNAKYIGIYPSDIENLELDRGIISAEKIDITRAENMKKLKWFNDERWQKEISLFLKKKKKLEIPALSQKGFRYLADTYIPNKIKELK